MQKTWVVVQTEVATFFQHTTHRDVTVHVYVTYEGARMITTFYLIESVGVTRLDAHGVRAALIEADELVREARTRTR